MSSLPEDFKDLVRNSLELLGKAIKTHYGENTYNNVESIRTHLKANRNADLETSLKAMSQVYERLYKLKKDEQFAITHSFAVALEIINACENAYRTAQLRKTPLPRTEFQDRITYVLTAHPTESRSPQLIEVMSRVSSIMIDGIQKNTFSSSELFFLFILALRNSVSRSEKPSVKDEADYIYSLALKEDTLDSLIDNFENKQTVFFRTWVGGDKDGHPGINAGIMIESLQASRSRLITNLQKYFSCFEEDLQLIGDDVTRKKMLPLNKKIKNYIATLKKVKPKDGKCLSLFQKELSTLNEIVEKTLFTSHPKLKKISNLLSLFPGLVIPLELRESSNLITLAMKKNKSAIWQMLSHLKKIAEGGNILSYARGLVISSTESTQDILNAYCLVFETTGDHKLPVIPLFESKNSLENSTAILEELFKNKNFVQTCQSTWSSRFEVMLGYSDSAKENGSLLSRYLIRRTLHSLDAFLQSKNITPIFFHGSGGSVARGGGSLEEQVSWWPESSKRIFKVTLQGEMIYRSLSTTEIFKSQVFKILQNSKKNTAQTIPIESELLSKLSYNSSEKYRSIIQDPNFLKLVELSTPYSFLNDLKIGSRPTKRIESFEVHSLRAIPWVLCWTQIRSLLPIWWGIGSSWGEFNSKEKIEIKNLYSTDKFFSSFVKLLAFSVAKVDLSVWFSYLKYSQLDKKIILEFEKKFSEEFESCKIFINDITGEESLLWFRPWLKQSISLRSTMIHPLNIAQIIALKNNDSRLLRESVTGIASGMLTTG